jgi:HEPN domain-containing protein
MTGEELREEYIEKLLDRITQSRYPSHELLQRAENLVHTREQAERLVRYLIGTVDGVRYPSHQMMDRVERILFGTVGR